MIPKTIHYCWFGRGEKSELIQSCIESWKRYCPDYEIIEWNEDNIDINSNRYMREAYENKKWAFVSDYARLYALVNHGGVYVDTDVEILKPIDRFLEHSAFSGFEDKEHVPTGIMGSEKDHPLMKHLLEQYDDKTFVFEDGSLNLETNTRQITDIMSKNGMQFNDTYQELEGMAFYPHDWFCPKDYYTDKVHLTENSHAIHHYNRSWCPPESKKAQFLRRHPRINKLVHLPNKIAMAILGDNYKKLKGLLKK